MLESLMSSTDGGSFTLLNSILIIGASIILGLIISLIYMRVNKKEGYSTDFTITLVILPVIISTIILLVGNNIARAFSLAGAFSIIRFRSAPGSPKDITYVFLTLAVGLACGMGFIGYAIMFTIVISALVLILSSINFAVPKQNVMQLKIIIPENLNYENVFDDILEEYVNSYKLNKVKTRDFGALFELNYMVDFKSGVSHKKFIDEIRCRNGNLNIILTSAGSNEE